MYSVILGYIYNKPTKIFSPVYSYIHQHTPSTMVFDKTKFVEYKDDPRYDMLTQAIRVDKDNKAYEMQFYQPTTGPGSYSIPTGAAGNVTNISCYNARFENYIFDVSLGPETKINPQGSFMILKYKAYQRRQTNAGNWLGCPVAPTAFDGTGEGWSLPWNTNNFFRDLQLLSGNSQMPLEQYVQGNYAAGNTIRYLHDFKRDALEANDMALMTPCIESKYDDDTLSAESALRAVRWLGSAGAAADNISAALAPKTFTKVIPLSEMFGCFQSPGIWTNCNKFRIHFTFKSPEELVFMCGAAAPQHTANTCICIEQVQLLVDQTRMSPVQAIESATEKVEGKIENIGYTEYFTQPMGNSSQILVTGQRDVQAVCLVYPASAAGAAVTGSTGAVRNPLQFDNGGISGFSVSYGSDLPIRTPLSLSSTRP